MLLRLLSMDMNASIVKGLACYATIKSAYNYVVGYWGIRVS